jgi:hypothetical protein
MPTRDMDIHLLSKPGQALQKPGQAEGVPGQKVPLGINAKFASPSDPRARRFYLQSVARHLLPGERVGRCYRVPFGKPEIWISPNGKAHYKKLVTCGSVWTCPVCAAKITERRRVELSEGLALWPGSVFMTTFTFQHAREDKLAELRAVLVEGVRSLKSGKWWIGFEKRYDLVGSVKGFEMTWSIVAGWHPHLHVLFFSRLQADQVKTEAIQAELSDHFIAIMEKAGRYVSGVHGVKVEKPCQAQAEGDKALKEYVAKWGLDFELAKAPVKMARDENGIKHYSPFQLLDLAGAGDKQAGLLFREYSIAMKGINSLRWSRGLRKAIGLHRPEKTDEELAQEPISVGDYLLARLEYEEWWAVKANDARAELLTVAEKGDEALFWAFLARLGAPARQYANLVWV